MATEPHKTCTRCERDRPLTAYAKQASHFTGRKPRCRECEAEQREEKAAERDRKAPVSGTYEAGFRDGVAEARKRLPILSADTVKAALALTHPDRHPASRRTEAGRVTAELSAYRDRLSPVRSPT